MNIIIITTHKNTSSLNDGHRISESILIFLSLSSYFTFEELSK